MLAPRDGFVLGLFSSLSLLRLALRAVDMAECRAVVMDMGALIAATQTAAEKLMGLQVRLIAKLAKAEEDVEEVLGLPQSQARSADGGSARQSAKKASKREKRPPAAT